MYSSVQSFLWSFGCGNDYLICFNASFTNISVHRMGFFWWKKSGIPGGNHGTAKYCSTIYLGYLLYSILIIVLVLIYTFKDISYHFEPRYNIEAVVVWSYGSWMHNYVCTQWLSLLKVWVRIPRMTCVLDTTLCDNVFQWRAMSFSRYTGFHHQ